VKVRVRARVRVGVGVRVGVRVGARVTLRTALVLLELPELDKVAALNVERVDEQDGVDGHVPDDLVRGRGRVRVRVRVKGER